MRNVAIGSLAAACVLLSACATVTRGTRQTFNIESSPTEAQVELSNGEKCVTPCKLKLKRRPGFTATVAKEGYQTQTVQVDSKVRGGGIAAGAGNILIGGVIGGIVDGTNGSMNNLTPNPLTVTLVPVGQTPADPAAPAATTTSAAPAAPAAPSETGGQ